MKTTIKTILALLILAAFSCSSDDSNDAPAVTIIETWKVTAIATANTYDLNNDGSATSDLITELGCTINQTITLKSDNTGTIKASTVFTIFEGTTVGTFEGLCLNTDELTEDFSWSETETSRTYTTNGTIFTGTLFGNQLVFIASEFPIYNNAGDDIVDTDSLQITYTLQ